MAQAKEQWGTRLGVIMAVAGSAVGLGNFLRFPGQAASNGGGVFMIPYFCALLLLGNRITSKIFQIHSKIGMVNHKELPCQSEFEYQTHTANAVATARKIEMPARYLRWMSCPRPGIRQESKMDMLLGRFF